MASAFRNNPPSYMNGGGGESNTRATPVHNLAEIQRSMDEYNRLENFFNLFKEKVFENREMAPKKQQEVQQKLDEEVARLREMVNEEYNKVSKDIEQCMSEHASMMKRLFQFLQKYTGQSTAAYNILKTAVENTDGHGPTEEEVQQAQKVLKQTMQTMRDREKQLDRDLGMMRNVELATTSVFAELTKRLTAHSLFFIRTCSLSPQDVSLSLGSEGTSGLHVGKMVEIQVKPIKADSLVKNLMSYNIKDGGNNVLEYTLKDVVGNRAGGFLIEFTPRMPAKHVVEVELYQQPVKNSPMIFKVDQYSPQEVAESGSNPVSSAQPPDIDDHLRSLLTRGTQGGSIVSSRLLSSAGNWSEIGLSDEQKDEKRRTGFAANSSLRVSSYVPGETVNGEGAREDQSTVAEFGSRNSSLIGRLEELTLEETPSFQAPGEEPEKMENAEKKEIAKRMGAPVTVNKPQETPRFHVGSYRGAKRDEEDWDEELSCASKELATIYVTGGTCQTVGGVGEKRPMEKKGEVSYWGEKSGFVESMGEERGGKELSAPGSSSETESEGIQDLPESSDGGETKPVLVVTFPCLGRDRPDLMKMYNGNIKKKGIYGRHLLTIGTWEKNTNRLAHLNSPIGCTRDEVSGVWIICDTDNNAVKLFNADGSTRLMLKDNFIKPSAVVMIDRGALAEGMKPDRLFAVKDDFCIHLFNSSGDSIKKIGQNQLRQPRGLALDSAGLLVTLNGAFRAGATTEVMCFDPSTGQLVRRLLFSPLMNAKPPTRCAERRRGPQPRFMDAQGNRLVVSDLGLNQVYVTDLNTGEEIGRFGDFGNPPEWFKFASGVSIDGDMNMVIGDAKKNRVQLFDNEGRFVCVLDLGVDGAIFVSDIHLTSNGLLMVMSRAKHVVKIFKLESMV